MTNVRFRKIKENGEIIAIFPDLCFPRYSNKEGDCMDYLHNGQHGECNYNYVMSILTTVADIDEYFPLLEELKSIGYDDLFIIP